MQALSTAVNIIMKRSIRVSNSPNYSSEGAPMYGIENLAATRRRRGAAIELALHDPRSSCTLPALVFYAGDELSSRSTASHCFHHIACPTAEAGRRVHPHHIGRCCCSLHSLSAQLPRKRPTRLAISSMRRNKWLNSNRSASHKTIHCNYLVFKTFIFIE